MTHFSGKTALVTGAASGIGLALSKALLERGARVWLTDIDATAVKAVAQQLGGESVSEPLDVRDASGFALLARRIASDYGGVDFLFNNAGIGIGGESHELTVEHFDRIIDINIRGVMNGIAAAYPSMVERGSGHIINTASAAGLLPVPLLASYSMTKHAVVGMSTSLRIEAERYGVRVSALCPTAIDTPLLDTEGPADLPKAWRPDLRAYLTRVGGAPMPVDAFAAYALAGVQANRALVVAPASARVSAFLQRLLPGVVAGRIRAALQKEMDERDSAAD